MTQEKNKAVNKNQERFKRGMLSPLKFKLFLIWNLPSVFFWGVRVTSLTQDSCEVTLPYSYRTKNPFRSIYFAAIAGAAELASGILCLFHLQGSQKFSTLVTGVEGSFLKKADQKITFSCKEGAKIEATKELLLQPGQTANLSLSVEGRKPDGELVARFTVHWSLKVKS